MFKTVHCLTDRSGHSNIGKPLRGYRSDNFWKGNTGSSGQYGGQRSPIHIRQ